MVYDGDIYIYISYDCYNHGEYATPMFSCNITMFI